MLCLSLWYVQVTLVGMVHDKDERNIDTSFMLDDTTGRIEIKRWLVLFILGGQQRIKQLMDDQNRNCSNV